jgi:hypothetical protein
LFADFAEAAARHGLQYVGEASFHRFAGPWEPEVEQALWRLADGDRVAYHQIVDFMVWRRFRDSLLCHAGRSVSAHLELERVMQLRFRPAGPVDGLGSAPSPILMELTAKGPQPVAFEELQRAIGAEPDRLGAELLDAARQGRVTMHRDPPVLGNADVECPRVSALARRQASIDSTYCTTLLGGMVKLDGSVIRVLLQLADGSRDREQIRADLAATGAPLLDPGYLDAALRDLAAMGLLEPN